MPVRAPDGSYPPLAKPGKPKRLTYADNAALPIPRQMRFRDEAVLEWARRRGVCELCRKTRPTEPHHCKPVGSGGSDKPGNVCPCCRECHDRVQEGDKGKIEVLTAIANRDWPKVLAEIEAVRQSLRPRARLAQTSPFPTE